MSDDRATVRLQRRYQAPSRRVFEAWTDPAKIHVWLKASAPGREVLRIDLKVKVGAPFVFVVGDNGREHTYAGEYLEVDRPRRLVFTWVASAVSKETTRVSVELSPAVTVAGGTDVSLVHERVVPGDKAEIEANWSAVLDAIGVLLERSG